jgi:hypothetical protein
MSKPIHCSSLPRVFDCPASIDAPEIDVQSSSEVSRLGSAVHWVLSEWITYGYAQDRILEAVEAWEVERDELSRLASLG